MSDWILTDEEPLPDGIVGGDGASDSVSIRFKHRTEPAQITVYLYAVDLTERGYSDEELDGEVFDIEEMVEFVCGTDPDDISSTEVWSDYVYQRPAQRFYPTVLDAEDFRDLEAQDWIDSGTDYLHWDGKTTT